MRLDREQKNRLWKVLAVTGIALLFLIGYALFFNLFGFGLPCVFNRLLGIECAGCGLSRAAAALLRLDFQAAFEYNAVWPLYLGYALWAAPAVSISYVRTGREIGFPSPVWLNYAILGILVSYGVIRNFI